MRRDDRDYVMCSASPKQKMRRYLQSGSAGKRLAVVIDILGSVLYRGLPPCCRIRKRNFRMSRPIIVAVAALLSASVTAWNYSATAHGGHGGFHGGLVAAGAPRQLARPA
jgi:hypothetical protein